MDEKRLRKIEQIMYDHPSSLEAQQKQKKDMAWGNFPLEEESGIYLEVNQSLPKPTMGEGSTISKKGAVRIRL